MLHWGSEIVWCCRFQQVNMTIYDLSRLTQPQLRRRKRIVEAAMVVLMRDGTLNLDQIIKISGGSKSAIYDFFGNKRGLEAAIGDEIYRRLDMLAVKTMKELDRLLASDQLDQAHLQLCLTRVLKSLNAKKAREALGLLMHDLSMRDELLSKFYQQGPEVIVAKLADLLQRIARRKKVTLPAPRRCAVAVFGMIFGPLMLDVVFSEVRKRPGGKVIEAQAEWGAALLMRGVVEGTVMVGSPVASRS